MASAAANARRPQYSFIFGIKHIDLACIFVCHRPIASLIAHRIYREILVSQMVNVEYDWICYGGVKGESVFICFRYKAVLQLSTHDCCVFRGAFNCTFVHSVVSQPLWNRSLLSVNI